jgi:hypothetical protein
MVAEYFLGLLRYHHPDSKIFIGINHGSDPVWINRLARSGLDIEIAHVRPEIQVTSDVAGFIAALEAYCLYPEEFDLVWFGHSKGASRNYADYIPVRFQHHRRFWSRRAAIERFFAAPRIGVFSHRYGLWDLSDAGIPSRGITADVNALRRIYQDACSPIGLTAWETVFVMRDTIVRRFTAAVRDDFFQIDPATWGADRWWFEGGFPSIASMQDFEPYVEIDTDGAGSQRDDIAFYGDPRQGARHAQEEVRRWREDPLGFQPRGLPRG